MISNMSFEFFYGFEVFTTFPAVRCKTFLVFSEEVILHLCHIFVLELACFTIKHFFFYTIFEIFFYSYNINVNQFIFIKFLIAFVVTLPAESTTYMAKMLQEQIAINANVTLVLLHTDLTLSWNCTGPFFKFGKEGSCMQSL